MHRRLISLWLGGFWTAFGGLLTAINLHQGSAIEYVMASLIPLFVGLLLTLMGVTLK